MRRFINKQKAKKWMKRYLPAEIVCTVTAMISATTVYALTNNHILTALAGTWGENLGFYSVHVIRDIRIKKRQEKSSGRDYTFISLLKNLRDTILEFGPAEIIDSFISRPFMMYIFPKIIGNVQLGIFIGKLAADLIVYIPIILSYELQQSYKKDK